MNPPSPLLPLRVNDIGEYIRYHSCERRFKLAFNNRAIAKQIPFSERLFNSIDPVLQEAGRQREDEWNQYLQDQGLNQVSAPSSQDTNAGILLWDDFIEALTTVEPGQSAYGREVSITGSLGRFEVQGRMDFVLLLWNEGRPYIRIVECKASRKNKTYHRIQVAVYRLLVQQLIDSQPLTVSGFNIPSTSIQTVVARIDESTSQNQAILEIPPLTLETEQSDVKRLIAINGKFSQIIDASLHQLPYHLESKCDDCVFSVYCLPESARLRSLHLLGIDPASVRLFNAAGIQTIDELADLVLNSSAARVVRESDAFTENLELLKIKAQARRKTLPTSATIPDEYEVAYLRHVGSSQLPSYSVSGSRLVRIYLSVEYDYVENRVGSLAAHITRSEGQLNTGFVLRGEHWQPDPIVKERIRTDSDGTAEVHYTERSLQGTEVVQFKRTSWTGNYIEDTSAERELIQGFLMQLVDKIAEVAESDEAPIHFYVWNRSEIAHLVEGCSRAGSDLLSHLRELLGCRESLEQLIYSAVGEDVNRRFALGWTSRGLVVTSSLKWFGRRYHWCRRIGGSFINLDREFQQDVFDFKTDLAIDGSGNWDTTERGENHKFEIRSRFNDSLSAPYWRAYWRRLPDPATVRERSLKNAIERYNNAQKPGLFEGYLKARVHALRWIEENILNKNEEIEKPLIQISSLPNFSLGVDSTARSAIDFLRLDQHINTSNWVSTNLVPPIYRVSSGTMIPVRNVRVVGRKQIAAEISLEGFDIDFTAFQSNCSLSEGSFIRLTPAFEAPERGQTLRQLFRGGFTCVLEQINWDSRQIRLDVISFSLENDRYRLIGGSVSNRTGGIFQYATIDESPSDFVAPRVDARLQQNQGRHAYQWFHPQEAQIPPQGPLEGASIEEYRELIETTTLPGGGHLDTTQVNAVLDGLSSRIQLLQGPPGTGKTATTSIAVLLRILERGNMTQVGRHQLGNIFLIAANTHTAVNNLLRRIDSVIDNFRDNVSRLGYELPLIGLSKIQSSEQQSPVGGNVTDIPVTSCVSRIKRLRRNHILVIGGTTSGLLKMVGQLNPSADFRELTNGFQASALIVDEASMIVFPHFLALATLVGEEGEIMLSGDHRQLAPIVAHDWEREDRPPVIMYQPYASAYEAVLNIKQSEQISDSQLIRSALSYTFRLPPIIRSLLSRIYERDDIILDGPPERALNVNSNSEETTPLFRIFENLGGLYLVLHTEAQSKKSNAFEAQIISEMLPPVEELDERSIAVITPHRAQRSLLKQELSEYSEAQVIDVIDTVERLQGDERPTVIVSATASDPSAISRNVEFILDLNRSNVAFSRTQERLIVVCSSSLLNYIPADYEHYESAMLWKALREICDNNIGTVQIGTFQADILTPSEVNLND